MEPKKAEEKSPTPSDSGGHVISPGQRVLSRSVDDGLSSWLHAVVELGPCQKLLERRGIGVQIRTLPREHKVDHCDGTSSHIVR